MTPLPPSADAVLPLASAIELQDELITACNDLDRLTGLLGQACAELSSGFHGAVDTIARWRGNGDDPHTLLTQIEAHLGRTVTALQVDDMAAQLILHTRSRLRQAADRLANDAMGGDDEDGSGVVEAARQRPNPVTQDEMDAGSIELF